MRTGVIAKKIGMSSSFDENGNRLTLTFLSLGGCSVVGQKTLDRDGYNAIVIGSGDVKASKLSKSVRSAFSIAQVSPKKKLKEFRVSDSNMLNVGVSITPEHYSIGQYIDVAGTSIGKGFAGVMKRHNFRGLEATHGVSISHRSHGSTGGCQDPGKVFKNKKMAGHMGVKRVTKQNLKVAFIDVENDMLVVNGSVPGPKGGYVYVTDAVKKSVLA